MQNRTKNAVVTLVVGLTLNIMLGVAKLVTGIYAASASVMSDAFNNLSDAAVSLVTIIATFLAARGADHDHPFGHGRYEYIATFVLGAVIVAVGAEVFVTGFKRAITPVDTEFGIAVLSTLGAAIAVKAFMGVFYTVHGKRIGSDTIKAAAVDSFSDAAVTTVVLVCAVIERYCAVNIDGYASMAVALVIIVFAVRILKSTVSRLLGERPDPELTVAVTELIRQEHEVLSVHDLIINDYGSSIKIAEADAVFAADLPFTTVHAVCDRIERNVYDKTGVRLSLHADPFVTDDERHEKIRLGIDGALAAFGATCHDIIIDDECAVVSLDVKIDGSLPENEISAQAEAQVRAVVPTYAVKIHIDYI